MKFSSDDIRSVVIFSVTDESQNGVFTSLQAVPYPCLHTAVVCLQAIKTEKQSLATKLAGT